MIRNSYEKTLYKWGLCSAEHESGREEEEGTWLEENGYIGGNHAQFGNYGVQKGDGELAISAEEQQGQTVAAIYEMITEHNILNGR